MGSSITPEYEAANEQFAATFDKGDLALPPSRYCHHILAVLNKLTTAKSSSCSGLYGRPSRPSLSSRHRARFRPCNPQRRRPRRRCSPINHHITATPRHPRDSHCPPCQYRLFSCERDPADDLQTDCGMLTFSDLDLKTKVRKELDQDVDHIAFLPFGDLEQSVRDDIAFLKKSPLVLDVPVTGYVYDVKTGKINKVDG